MKQNNLKLFSFIILIQLIFFQYAYPNYSIRCEGHSLHNGKSNSVFQLLNISYDQAKLINQYQLKYSVNNKQKKYINYINGVETHYLTNHTANFNWNNVSSSILDLKNSLSDFVKKNQFITFKLNIIQNTTSGILDIYHTIHLTKDINIKNKVLLSFIPGNLNIQKTQALPFTNVAYSTGPRYIQVKKRHGMASVLRTQIKSAYFFNKIKCEPTANNNMIHDQRHHKGPLKTIDLRKIQSLGIIKIIFDLLVEAIHFNQSKFFWKDSEKELNDKKFYKKLSNIIARSKWINKLFIDKRKEGKIEDILFSLISEIYTNTTNTNFKKINRSKLVNILRKLHSLLSTSLQTKPLEI